MSNVNEFTFLENSGTTALVSAILTDKGRALLANTSYQEIDNFDIVKFAFGDSEIDYDLSEAEIEAQAILIPSKDGSDFKFKLYASGVIPSGSPTVNLSTTTVSIRSWGIDIVTAKTSWPPIDGAYIEDFVWTNLGPLNDWDFKLEPAANSRSATISAYDVVGTTTIKVAGQTSGRFALIELTITA